MGRLDDKIAVVTGAARGLGEGIARRLATRARCLRRSADVSEVAASRPASPSGANRLPCTST